MASTDSRWPSICPTAFREPGTCKSDCSGSRPLGWPPACSSVRWSAITNRRFQRLGVNVLFAALLLVVVGSLAGEWLSIQNQLTDTVSFYFGHQGYEYVDLGRFWQIALMVGLLLWLVLMIRVLLPAIRQRNTLRRQTRQSFDANSTAGQSCASGQVINGTW